MIDSHDPWVDVDADGFSTIENYRGWDWRGADCDDSAGDVYPGAVHTTHTHAHEHEHTNTRATRADATHNPTLTPNHYR